jgi:DNA repair exonuclease SbcCD ATPase subunit
MLLPRGLPQPLFLQPCVRQVVKYRPPGQDERVRMLSQLSGGERRRVALALCLAFADLVRQYGRLSCNVLVLDEVR